MGRLSTNDTAKGVITEMIRPCRKLTDATSGPAQAAIMARVVSMVVAPPRTTAFLAPANLAAVGYAMKVKSSLRKLERKAVAPAIGPREAATRGPVSEYQPIPIEEERVSFASSPSRPESINPAATLPNTVASERTSASLPMEEITRLLSPAPTSTETMKMNRKRSHSPSMTSSSAPSAAGPKSETESPAKNEVTSDRGIRVVLFKHEPSA